MPHPARWILPTLIGAGLALTTVVPAHAGPLDYRLRFGDSVNVTVLNHPELSVQAQPVHPDGAIALPLVEEVAVGGKTLSEAATTLGRAYRPFLTNPQVVLSVAKFHPLKVTVMGQVTRPGTFDFEEEPTLVDAIANAGGLTERGARNAIKVMDPAGKAHTYDLDRLLGAREAMPHLAEGTVIEVGETWMPDWYRILPVLTGVVTACALLAQVHY